MCVLAAAADDDDVLLSFLRETSRSCLDRGIYQLSCITFQSPSKRFPSCFIFLYSRRASQNLYPLVRSQKLAFDALARIEEYKQEVKYVDHTSNAVDKELAKCNEIHEDFEKTIDETKREVESLKLKLREEQKRRAEREECETLGKQINTFPPYEQSVLEIDALKSELSSLDKRYQAAVDKMELRTKQVRLLMQSIQDLEAALKEDGVKIEDPMDV